MSGRKWFDYIFWGGWSKCLSEFGQFIGHLFSHFFSNFATKWGNCQFSGRIEVKSTPKVYQSCKMVRISEIYWFVKNQHCTVGKNEKKWDMKGASNSELRCSATNPACLAAQPEPALCQAALHVAPLSSIIPKWPFFAKILSFSGCLTKMAITGKPRPIKQN